MLTLRPPALVAALGLALVAGAVMGFAVDETRRGSGAALGSGAPPVPSISTAPSRGPASSGLALPTPRRWAARTIADVTANIATDTWATQRISAMQVSGSPVYTPGAAKGVVIGVPVRVPGLEGRYPDEWLIPLNDTTGKTIAVIAALIMSDETAFAGYWTGWSGAFPHPASIADAQAKGSAPGDPATSVDLVWGKAGATQGYPADLDHPFYRIVRRSGMVLYLYSTGEVVPATAVQ